HYALRWNVLTGSQSGQLKTETELDASDHDLGHTGCEPVRQAGQSQYQHDHAYRQPASVKNTGTDLLGEYDGGYGFERLSRHRQTIGKSGQNLHDPEHDEHTGSVEVGYQNHGGDEWKIGSNVTE